MKKIILKTIATFNPIIKNSMSRATAGSVLFLIPLLLACFVFSPRAQAVLPPPAPDGFYPGANTAEGQNALFSLTTGQANTGDGYKALFTNTTGSRNTATGMTALFSNLSGQFNTADGFQALYHSTTADANTATGYQALFNNATGEFNTADGFQALVHNTTGTSNAASGYQALHDNTTGAFNTAVGVTALHDNIGGLLLAGSFNTAVGWGALQSNTTGAANTAVGVGAGSNNVTGGGNVYLGINVPGFAGEDSTTYISNIYDSVVTTRAVFVNAAGKLGTTLSTRRVKDDIKPMEKVSEAILALKPVTFRYKKEIEPGGAIQFGLIAEEVGEVNPDLIIRDKGGKPESVRYEAVNAMLLNEFIKEHRKVQQLEASVAQQQKGMEVLAAQLKEQSAQIQKVSAQLEVNKPAPRTVADNR